MSGLLGNSGRGGGGGQQQQMMMGVSVSSVCMVCLMMLVFGFMYMQGTGANGPASCPTGQTRNALTGYCETPAGDGDTSTSTSTSGSVSSGRYKIKYGGVSMVGDSKSCASKKVWFEDTQDNDQHLWNLEPVAGKDYYYIANENKLFKKGCSSRYLTVPKDCQGAVSLDRPQYADRQYWRVVGGTEGAQLQSVSCANKRWASYLTSNGVKSGPANRARMTNRGGSPYVLESVSTD